MLVLTATFAFTAIVVPTAPWQRPRPTVDCRSSMLHFRHRPVSMVEQIPRPEDTSFPFRSAILAFITVQSAIGLLSDNELLGLVTRLGDPTLNINYFSTLVDAAFVGCAQTRSPS